MTNIIAALRVKNEGRWIREVLEAIQWCEAIYMMDDHSADDTREIARVADAEVIESPFDTFDEARDKEWLIERVAQKHKLGDWVLMVDGDEVLEPGAEAGIRREIARGGAISLSFQIKYLWNSRTQYRVDGVYGGYNRPRIFRLDGRYSFRRSGAPGNLHCFCVPESCARNYRRTPISLLHLGYMDKEDRMKKWKFYNALDPFNVNEGYDPKHPERGSYPWIVQGDIPAVPAHLKLKHAGPLELRAL